MVSGMEAEEGHQQEAEERVWTFESGGVKNGVKIWVSPSLRVVVVGMGCLVEEEAGEGQETEMDLVTAEGEE